MRERPILFSAPMILAVLNGTKTQTRRIVKARHDDGVITGAAAEPYHAIERSGGGRGFNASRIECVECPHGVPGDHLWCRETFRTLYDPATCLKGALDIDYRADGVVRIADTLKGKKNQLPWKPSIYMPRWASRITLEITEVRVERLQDISEADARAEGVRLNSMTHWATEARDAYKALWDSINGKTYPWRKNPYVWVISFTPIQKVLQSQGFSL